MSQEFFGVKDDLGLGVNTIKVLQRRYLLQNKKGVTIETPSRLFRRVADAIASIETNYNQNIDVKKISDQFYKMMSSQEFLPNTPTLMNAGTEVGQLSACFVIPVGDSLQEIFEAVKWTAIIHQSGGGTGFNFSKLRPQGDLVRSTGGVASGPVKFMTIFDKTTEVIKQGGKRRGANMGILRVDHPDILEFISCKSKEGFLDNFNISVAVTDKFMNAVKNNQDYSLVNPRTKRIVGKLNAKKVFELIITSSWDTGDPGIIFIDEINRHNPTPFQGDMEATNPCGEQPLLDWESCNLGSINLAKVVTNHQLNWKKLSKLVHLGVRFLDNVIDANKYPSDQIRLVTLSNRKIGIGVMGFADALIKMNIAYNSEKAFKIGEKIMKFIKIEGHHASQILGKERGNFPNFEKSIWKNKYDNMRNATVTTIAPTGTISIIAGCSSGIEPLFAVSYVRNVMEGTRLLETNHDFEKMARRANIFSQRIIHEITENGSIQNISGIPKNLKRLFVTALDTSPEVHIRMQSVFQKHTDNAVSKTVNLPQGVSPDEVKKAYLLAYKLKSKGVTVYRYGSKSNQVLTVESTEKGLNKKQMIADSEFGGGCEGIVCPH
ncbi:MAG: adenosylcobalamin-dependent ribonucleoside-diphosphate reductase [Thaumarchaeota archaeon]|nr:adenosylcobalamin-dependent ribonucleoside-diphosphate reductase [Nitrososphaerota archaeon]